MTRIKRDSIAYLLIIGFGIFLLTWAIPNYTPAYPGYGASASMVPIVSVSVIIFMATLALIFIAISHFTKKPMPIEEREFPEDLQDDSGFTQVGRADIPNLAKVMIPSVLLVVAIEYIGYALASFIYLMVIQYFIGCRKCKQSIVLAIILTAVLYVIMRYGFGVPVPGPQFFE